MMDENNTISILNRVQYINMYDIMEQLNRDTEAYMNDITTDTLSYIKEAIQTKWCMFSIDIYQKFKDELYDTYKGKLEELKEIVDEICNPTTNKDYWINEIENKIKFQHAPKVIFTNHSLGIALYLVNKQAKIYRDLRNQSYEVALRLNQQPKVEKGLKYDKQKNELYNLKASVIDSLIESGWETFYCRKRELPMVRVGSFKFHHHKRFTASPIKSFDIEKNREELERFIERKCKSELASSKVNGKKFDRSPLTRLTMNFPEAKNYLELFLLNVKFGSSNVDCINREINRQRKKNELGIIED
jgi:hypothetical protein